MNQDRKITREELHQLVWAKPRSRVTKEFGPHVDKPVRLQADFILLEELRLLAPDLVIFRTGPWNGYDERISSLLQAQELPLGSYSQRLICEFRSPFLKGRVFRTYHPNYLQRSSRANEVIKALGLAMRIYSDNSLAINGVPLEIRQIRPMAKKDSHRTLPLPTGRVDMDLSLSYTLSEFELIR